MEVKTYRTTRNRTRADGTVYQIEVNRKYKVKPPALSAEQVAEIRGLVAAGTAKTQLAKIYGVSPYIINKFLAQ